MTSSSQRSVSSLRVSKKPWWQPFGAAADDGDITSTPAFLQKKLEVLGTELATLKADKEAIDAQSKLKKQSGERKRRRSQMNTSNSRSARVRAPKMRRQMHGLL